MNEVIARSWFIALAILLLVLVIWWVVSSNDGPAEGAS